jgi:tRNA nucleotidyltransferase (CCA-adding enzyme)
MGTGASRVVIVEDGRVVGIVTRNDALEALALQEQPVASEEERLAALPAAVRDLLARCGEVGDGLDMGVYVVGGFVRDVLLGRENLDIDVVAEGDGLLLAARLAERLGGRASLHEKFGTAVVTGPEGLKLDVASARLEFYTRPAALPEVTGSTLKQDLFRRDFTINAMAIQLNRSRWGRLVDFFGARRDLRDGVVRVLHNLSFVDDPTRIFRAIKFEQRYHFRMEPHTERLLRQAVGSKWLEALSPARVRDEFVQILSEARPLPAIVRMAELRVLRLIHPRLQLAPRVRELLDSITRVLARYAALAPLIQRWLVYFRGLVSGLSEEDLREVAERYRVPTDTRRRLFLDREAVRHLLRRLYRRRLLPSEIYRLLAPISLEMVLYLLARAKARSVKEKLVLYLDRLREMAPLVRGRDLRAWGYPPGPTFGPVLERLRDAWLDGKIHDLEEARAWLEEADIVRGWT